MNGKKAKSFRLRRELPATLLLCATEEEVKSEYAKAFGLKLRTAKRMDLYTPQILFEFKFEQNLARVGVRAKVIAQTLYYIRELTFGSSALPVPPAIGVVDQNEGFFVDTKEFKGIVESRGRRGQNFDWDRAPSTPCPNIVDAVKNLAATRQTHVYNFSTDEDWSNYCARLTRLQEEQFAFDFDGLIKKSITENNFEAAFVLWTDLFGQYVENGRKPSEYFAADIQRGRSVLLRELHEVAFTVSGGQTVRKPMPIDKYSYFWDTYQKCDDMRVVHSIWQRIDRLTNEDLRRFTGEFYTPVTHAQKALEYLDRVVGPKWWENGFRIWDMAAGTGNLEYKIPEEALPFCYISSLLEDDVNYCRMIYPTANVFQYDYLNDDVKLLFGQQELDLVRLGATTKMPKKLYDQLRDPNLKWIIFINPPFATANDNSRGSANKDDVSMTAVRELMTGSGLGEVSRELYSQFLWRIGKEFQNRSAYLGMFSKLKYVNSNNDRKLREDIFKYHFESGFCFPSESFHGTKGKFPIGFLIWNLSEVSDLNKQKIVLDIFDQQLDKVGTKVVSSVDRNTFLSRWVPRIRNTTTLPPLSNAISVADGRADPRERVAAGFLCSLMAKGNEFANQNYTALLSGPYVSAGAFSVTPENFERALIAHTVRRLPRASWLNDRDQWLAPNKSTLPPEFVSDAIVWSLFSASNNTASFTAAYKGRTYRLTNELFPFLLSEVRDWRCSLSSISHSLELANRDRYAAKWISKNPSSAEARTLLNAGRRTYKYFYEQAALTPHPRFKIAFWDVGWWQTRQALKEAQIGAGEVAAVDEAHQSLKIKILPQIEELGFLQGGEHFFADEPQ